jgi:hypothetical protein
VLDTVAACAGAAASSDRAAAASEPIRRFISVLFREI